ncbi:MAG: SDR family oxidoreductase [Myxococcales bacterium]|mgnify:FL=1|nr:SDR family oxidoreductase [Myxococcales bacterium]
MRRHHALVLGGAGFVGSHLCDRLLARGDTVYCFDNLETGRLENIAHLDDHERFVFVRGDVVVPFQFPVDRIYNLACPASPPRYQVDPVKTTLTSVLGTLNALRLGARSGARVFFASTSEVYGDPEVHPQPEVYRGCVNTVGPRACYDEGKRCAESLMTDFARQHGVEIRIARIFNTYGPRMDPADGRIVSNFITQALCSEDLTVYGDGTQTRSFCYVDDLIDGIVALMDHPTFSEPVNLGNPDEFTVLALADLVRELTRSECGLVFGPLPEDDPKLRRPVVDRARDLIGFRPKVKLREGLERTIEYFEAQLEAELSGSGRRLFGQRHRPGRRAATGT